MAGARPPSYSRLAPTSWAVIATVPFLYVGSCSMPTLLGYLCELANPEDVGRMQGAADTVRTIASVAGNFVVSAVFAYLIRDSMAHKMPQAALLFVALISFIANVVFRAFVPE
eukprot:gene7763-9934_t